MRSTTEKQNKKNEDCEYCKTFDPDIDESEHESLDSFLEEAGKRSDIHYMRSHSSIGST